MKAIRSNTKISPHGGAVPILKKIKEFGIPQVIRACLGKRKEQSKYGYEDVFIAWVLTALCGGTRLEHISKLKKKLNIIPGLKLPSHDTLGRVMKKLACETKTHRNLTDVADVYTDYNTNLDMCRMLIKATKRTGILKDNRAYTMDIDATFLATLCRGARRKFNKKGKIDYERVGFSPMVCLIGNLPVFLSLRNGNAGARFQIYETIENSIALLNEAGIKIGKVRSDAAGFSKKTLAMLDNKGIKFNIRFPHQSKMLTFNEQLKTCETWRKTEIKTANSVWNCEVADINYTMSKRYFETDEAKTYRVVVARMPTEKTLKKLGRFNEIETKELNRDKLELLAKKGVLKPATKSNPYKDNSWKEIDGYYYKFYITNDYKSTSEEIINELNKRGDAERKFSFMKNDFGWKFPPFSNMHENTVFLIAASLANNIFRGMVEVFNKVLPELRLNARLREFQFVFIDVACAFINGEYVFYNTDIAFEKIR